ncbi:MAG: AraC family transcriptional regulator [Rikenellaceae bacterium]
MNNSINEISPLSEKDCFYIVDRNKSMFTYPLHRHEEYELNFVENGAGVVRVVGDSVEQISEYDLVLIASENLEHVWEQGECQSDSIHEITIQFSSDIFADSLLMRNQFESIRKMLDRAKQGLVFPLSAIMNVYSQLSRIAEEQKGFYQILKILAILYELSLCKDSRELSNTSFTQVQPTSDSRRISKVESYIAANYQEEITLTKLADIAGMSSSAFSRFFKMRAGRTLSDYLTDIRIGAAARMLIDTTDSIQEICFSCGFNNLSNFNRTFKRRKTITPKEFRDLYRKTKIIC